MHVCTGSQGVFQKIYETLGNGGMLIDALFIFSSKPPEQKLTFKLTTYGMHGPHDSLNKSGLIEIHTKEYPFELMHLGKLFREYPVLKMLRNLIVNTLKPNPHKTLLHAIYLADSTLKCNFYKRI